MFLVTECLSTETGVVDWVKEKIDLSKSTLPWLTRWYLGRDRYSFEGGTAEDLKNIIVARTARVIDSMFDTIDYPPLTDVSYSMTISWLMSLVEANLDSILLAMNGEKSPQIARAFPRKRSMFMGKNDTYWTWVSRNALFYNNLRLFLQNLFYEKVPIMIMRDVITAETAVWNEKAFEELARKYEREIGYFSHDSVKTSNTEDMRQEWLLTLWNCVCRYKGQNFIPFRAYFLRALRNRKIDLIRSANRDKRYMQIRAKSCPFLNWDTYEEQQVSENVHRSWEHEYFMWINSPDSLDDTPFQWIKIGSLWDRTGESPSETHIEEMIGKLFQLCCDKLYWRLEDELQPIELEVFRYWYKNGGELLRRIIEEKFGSSDSEGLMSFLQTFWLGKIWFHEEAITITHIDLGLEQLFIERAKLSLQHDFSAQKHMKWIQNGRSF